MAVHPSVLDRLVFVPVPPSKVRSDATHDDRLVHMLRQAELARPYGIDLALPAPGPGVVAAIDDLLATGAHFRAAARVLNRAFPT